MTRGVARHGQGRPRRPKSVEDKSGGWRPVWGSQGRGRRVRTSRPDSAGGGEAEDAADLFPCVDLHRELPSGGNRRNRPGERRGRGGEVEDDFVAPGPPRLEFFGEEGEGEAVKRAVVFDLRVDDWDDAGEFGNRGDYGGSSVGRESETRGSRGGGMECGAGGGASLPTMIT